MKSNIACSNAPAACFYIEDTGHQTGGEPANKRRRCPSPLAREEEAHEHPAINLQIAHAYLKRASYFPQLHVSEKPRADYFRKRCLMLGISGVTFHSYLGRSRQNRRLLGTLRPGSLPRIPKAVHRAHAKRAEVKLPSLEEFESKENKIAVGF